MGGGGGGVMKTFFDGITKLDLFYGSFLCILGSLYRIGIFLGIAKFSNIFGVLEIPDIVIG